MLVELNLTTPDGIPKVALTGHRNWEPYRGCFEVPDNAQCWLAVILPSKVMGYGNTEQEAIDHALMNEAHTATAQAGTATTSGAFKYVDVEDTLYDDDKARVEDLLKIESGLSEWEVNFVESLGKWVLDDRKTLTDKQRTRADEILANHS